MYKVPVTGTLAVWLNNRYFSRVASTSSQKYLTYMLFSVKNSQKKCNPKSSPNLNPNTNAKPNPKINPNCNRNFENIVEN